MNENIILFDTISFDNKEKFDGFVDNLSSEQSYLILIQAVKFAYNTGCFSLAESELISKSIRKIQKNVTE
jgi:hypothetical protein